MKTYYKLPHEEAVRRIKQFVDECDADTLAEIFVNTFNAEVADCWAEHDTCLTVDFLRATPQELAILTKGLEVDTETAVDRQTIQDDDFHVRRGDWHKGSPTWHVFTKSMCSVAGPYDTEEKATKVMNELKQVIDG